MSHGPSCHAVCPAEFLASNAAAPGPSGAAPLLPPGEAPGGGQLMGPSPTSKPDPEPAPASQPGNAGEPEAQQLEHARTSSGAVAALEQLQTQLQQAERERAEALAAMLKVGRGGCPELGTRHERLGSMPGALVLWFLHPSGLPCLLACSALLWVPSARLGRVLHCCRWSSSSTMLRLRCGTLRRTSPVSA